jgi:mannose-6-phosphate isomerase-like protein (cupin superfamily)
MPTLIPAPTRVEAAGNKPIVIDEFVGLVNSRESRVSIARIQCPPGWIEPPQTPEFDEYTVVLSGRLRVSAKDGDFDLRAGQAILTRGGERVQYSTPAEEGADYIAVCLPAYSFERAHRDA